MRPPEEPWTYKKLQCISIRQPSSTSSGSSLSSKKLGYDSFRSAEWLGLDLYKGWNPNLLRRLQDKFNFEPQQLKQFRNAIASRNIPLRRRLTRRDLNRLRDYLAPVVLEELQDELLMVGEIRNASSACTVIEYPGSSLPAIDEDSLEDSRVDGLKKVGMVFGIEDLEASASDFFKEMASQSSYLAPEKKRDATSALNAAHVLGQTNTSFSMQRDQDYRFARFPDVADVTEHLRLRHESDGCREYLESDSNEVQSSASGIAYRPVIEKDASLKKLPYSQQRSGPKGNDGGSSDYMETNADQPINIGEQRDTSSPPLPRKRSCDVKDHRESGRSYPPGYVLDKYDESKCENDTQIKRGRGPSPNSRIGPGLSKRLCTIIDAPHNANGGYQKGHSDRIPILASEVSTDERAGLEQLRSSTANVDSNKDGQHNSSRHSSHSPSIMDEALDMDANRVRCDTIESPIEVSGRSSTGRYMSGSADYIELVEDAEVCASKSGIMKPASSSAEKKLRCRSTSASRTSNNATVSSSCREQNSSASGHTASTDHNSRQWKQLEAELPQQLVTVVDRVVQLGQTTVSTNPIMIMLQDFSDLRSLLLILASKQPAFLQYLIKLLKNASLELPPSSVAALKQKLIEFIQIHAAQKRPSTLPAAGDETKRGPLTDPTSMDKDERILLDPDKLKSFDLLNRHRNKLKRDHKTSQQRVFFPSAAGDIVEKPAKKITIKVGSMHLNTEANRSVEGNADCGSSEKILNLQQNAEPMDEGWPSDETLTPRHPDYLPETSRTGFKEQPVAAVEQFNTFSTMMSELNNMMGDERSQSSPFRPPNLAHDALLSNLSRQATLMQDNCSEIAGPSGSRHMPSAGGVDKSALFHEDVDMRQQQNHRWSNEISSEQSSPMASFLASTRSSQGVEFSQFSSHNNPSEKFSEDSLAASEFRALDILSQLGNDGGNCFTLQPRASADTDQRQWEQNNEAKRFGTFDQTSYFRMTPLADVWHMKAAGDDLVWDEVRAAEREFAALYDTTKSRTSSGAKAAYSNSASVAAKDAAQKLCELEGTVQSMSDSDHRYNTHSDNNIRPLIGDKPETPQFSAWKKLERCSGRVSSKYGDEDVAVAPVSMARQSPPRTAGLRIGPTLKAVSVSIDLPCGVKVKPANLAPSQADDIKAQLPVWKKAEPKALPAESQRHTRLRSCVGPLLQASFHCSSSSGERRGLSEQDSPSQSDERQRANGPNTTEDRVEVVQQSRMLITTPHGNAEPPSRREDNTASSGSDSDQVEIMVNPVKDAGDPAELQTTGKTTAELCFGMQQQGKGTGIGNIGSEC